MLVLHLSSLCKRTFVLFVSPSEFSLITECSGKGTSTRDPKKYMNMGELLMRPTYHYLLKEESSHPALLPPRRNHSSSHARAPSTLSLKWALFMNAAPDCLCAHFRLCLSDCVLTWGKALLITFRFHSRYIGNLSHGLASLYGVGIYPWGQAIICDAKQPPQQYANYRGGWGSGGVGEWGVGVGGAGEMNVSFFPLSVSNLNWT